MRARRTASDWPGVGVVPNSTSHNVEARSPFSMRPSTGWPRYAIRPLSISVIEVSQLLRSGMGGLLIIELKESKVRDNVLVTQRRDVG